VQLSYGAQLSHLCSFLRWLPRHAALVSSIIIEPPYSLEPLYTIDGLPLQRHLEAAQQLLQQAVAAAGQDGSEHLTNISSIHLIADTGMLTALPAHSLTNLDVRLGLLGPVDGQAASAALARLTNLQQLQMTTSGTDFYSCLPGVAQLSQLTSLKLTHFAVRTGQGGDPQQLQQLLAQPLPLRELHLHITLGGSELPQLDMAHLTQLQVLSIRRQLNATFPPQLQQLTLEGTITEQQLEAVLQMQQLQRLKFSASRLQQPHLLARLAQLPDLQHLSLRYSYTSEAAATASAWQQLPALCELEVGYMGSYASIQEWEVIINGLAALTSVTKLYVTAAAAAAAAAEAMGACAQLARLTNLRELCIDGESRIAPGDALALTALTGLRSLVLNRVGAGVGDTAAAAIAGSCKQLCRLDLSRCGLLSMGCLANMRHLTQLTELWLTGNSGLMQQGLMQLTGLTRLQRLGVDRNAEVTDEVVDRFWAALRGQQQQQEALVPARRPVEHPVEQKQVGQHPVGQQHLGMDKGFTVFFLLLLLGAGALGVVLAAGGAA
jgi:hypothetical protein